MEFGAVGLVMLAIVLLYYLRMVSERAAQRKHSDKVSAILAQVEVFESAADDTSALKTVKEGLQRFPDHPALTARCKTIEQRLQDNKTT